MYARASWSRPNVAAFCRTRERWGKLSNFAGGMPIVLHGLRMRTSEHLYQICKFGRDAADVQAEVAAIDRAWDAKQHAWRRVHEGRGAPGWEGVSLEAMRWTLEVKAMCHPRQVREVLADTGGRDVVELSKRDDFWGAVPRKGTQMLDGMNMLGRLWQELRDGGGVDRVLEEGVAPPAGDWLYVGGRRVVHLMPAEGVR